MDLAQAGDRRVVGLKQTRRAIKEQQAIAVFLASDAHEPLQQTVKALCEQAGLVPQCAGNMRELGRKCGIEVGAATAAILKDA